MTCMRWALRFGRSGTSALYSERTRDRDGRRRGCVRHTWCHCFAPRCSMCKEAAEWSHCFGRRAVCLPSCIYSQALVASGGACLSSCLYELRGLYTATLLSSQPCARAPLTTPTEMLAPHVLEHSRLSASHILTPVRLLKQE